MIYQPGVVTDSGGGHKMDYGSFCILLESGSPSSRFRKECFEMADLVLVSYSGNENAATVSAAASNRLSSALSASADVLQRVNASCQSLPGK